MFALLKQNRDGDIIVSTSESFKTLYLAAKGKDGILSVSLVPSVPAAYFYTVDPYTLYSVQRLQK